MVEIDDEAPDYGSGACAGTDDDEHEKKLKDVVQDDDVSYSNVNMEKAEAKSTLINYSYFYISKHYFLISFLYSV